ALAPPMPNVPAPNMRGVGGGIHAAFLLGSGLLPTATRQGQGASGGCACLGLHMEPYPLPGLAGAHPVQCIRLSPSAQTPQRPALAPPGEGLRKHRKKTLTAPLRAWFGEARRMAMAAWLSASTLLSAHRCLCHCV